MASIFDDPEREYCYLSRVKRYRRIAGGARFSVLTNGGEDMALDIHFVLPHVLRVRCRRSGEQPPAFADVAAPSANVSVEAEDGRIVIRSDALELRIVRRPFHYGVFDFTGRKLLVQQIGDVTPTRLVSLPLGYARDARGRISFHESFELAPGERLHSPQHGDSDLRGSGLIWRPDAADSTPPLIWSSHGYGIAVCHAAETVYELGGPSSITVSFRVDDPFLDYLVVFGAGSEEITGRYAEVVGGGRSR